MESIETKLNQRQLLLSPFLVHEVNFFCHEEDTDRSHPSLVSVLSEMNLMKLSLGLPLYQGADGASVSHISKELHLFFYETILCIWVDISFLKTHFIKFILSENNNLQKASKTFVYYIWSVPHSLATICCCYKI